MTKYCRDDHTPEWFDLKNYEPLKDMGREDIYEVIRKRRYFYRWVVKSFERRGELPIPDTSDKSFASIFKLFNSDLAIDDDPLAVKDLDFFTAAEIIMGVEESESEAIVAFRKELIELQSADYGYDDSGIQFTWADFIGDTKEYGLWEAIPMELDEKVITIDLSHNDDKIIDDMREWLKEQRGNKKIARLTQKDIENGIINNRIAPCMDLLFWGKIKGINFTNAQLGDILFPDASLDRAEKVRKTTRKEAIKYLTTNAYSHIL